MSRVPTEGEIQMVLKNRPARVMRERLDMHPTYTVPEAAQMLAIGTRTLFSWYDGTDPILMAARMIGSVHLLSFRDLEEAYRVHLLRTKYNYSMQSLRVSMMNARKMFRTQHPLQRADAVQRCVNDLIYWQPPTRNRPARVTSLRTKPGQRYHPEIAELFSQRILSGQFIFPWRNAAHEPEAKPLSISPAIMSGRLVIAGTRVPVSIVAGMFREGMIPTAIAEQFRIETKTVEQALTHLKLHPKVA